MPIYVIGDIHGCSKQLKEMWKKIKFNKATDKVIFLGDYIDRGPDSYGVIKFIQRKQRQFGRKRIVALRGNHEQMAIDALKYPKEIHLFYGNGGCATVRSYEQNGAQLIDDLKWFESLPIMHEEEYFIAVHAGLNPQFDISNQQEMDMLWIREEFHKAPEGTFNKPVLFGHSITHYYFEEGYGFVPVLVNGNLALDTGCVAAGHLTCAILEGSQVTGFLAVIGRTHEGQSK